MWQAIDMAFTPEDFKLSFKFLTFRGKESEIESHQIFNEIF